MDRLARNVEDMLRLVREMNDRDVSVHFVKENMSFTAGLFCFLCEQCISRTFPLASSRILCRHICQPQQGTQ